MAGFRPIEGRDAIVVVHITKRVVCHSSQADAHALGIVRRALEDAIPQHEKIALSLTRRPGEKRARSAK